MSRDRAYRPRVHKQVRTHRNCRALVRLLKKLVAVLRSVGTKRVLILCVEATQVGEGGNDQVYRAEACLRVRELVLVNEERVGGKVVGEILEVIALVEDAVDT